MENYILFQKANALTGCNDLVTETYKHRIEITTLNDDPALFDQSVCDSDVNVHAFYNGLNGNKL